MNDLIDTMVSSVSDEEFFRYYCKDVNATTIYEDVILPKIAELEGKVGIHQKDYEWLEESEGQARALLEQIYYNYQNFRSCKELKKFIEKAFENSYFEM